MVSSFKRLSLLALFSWTAFSVQADYKDDIGYTALAQQLGVNLPTGAGVKVSQIEADENGAAAGYYYLPSGGAGDSITDVSGISSGFSGHATAVGSYFYGPTSIAPNLGVLNINPVLAYEAVDWIDNSLNYGQPLTAPEWDGSKIQNHSWVAPIDLSNTGQVSFGVQTLQRTDLLIQNNDVVSVVGVHNGGNPVADVLSGAYNVISVGNTSGNHMYQPTQIYGAGRQRVHLVAPENLTSYSTPMVSSAAALLVETARTKNFSNGDKSETIKAVLMAGATKTDVPNWSYAVHGAGELNIQNSYNIMARGEQTAGGLTTLAAASGWDFSAVNSAQDQVYRIYVDQNSPLSVVLTWNAVVSGSNYNSLTTTVADLDLKVYFSSDSTLGTLQNSTGSGSGGLSTIDNVEHLWWENVNAGYYSFVISSKSSASTEYALAWQAVPEPSRALLILAGFVSIIWVRRRSSK